MLGKLTLRQLLIFGLWSIGTVGLLIFGMNIHFHHSINSFQKTVRESEANILNLTTFRASARELLSQLMRSHYVMHKVTYTGLESAESEFSSRISSIQPIWISPHSNSEKTSQDEWGTFLKITNDMLAIAKEATTASSATGEETLQADANYDWNFRLNFLPTIETQIVRHKEHLTQLSEQLDGLQATSFRVTTGLLLIAFFLNLIILRQILRVLNCRISSLNCAFSELSQGNFNHKIEVKGRDELSLLANKFNTMALALHTAQSKIEEQRATLLTNSKFSELGQMAAGIAHEINNPLAIIQGKTRLLTRWLKNIEATGKEKALTDIEKIHSTAERITKIIIGLRTISRNSEADPLTPNSLQQLIQDTLSLCSERLKSTGVELQVECETELTIHCRPAQISQVILNLLNNSYDAIQILDEKWIRLEVDQSMPTHVHIKVTDSGPGIPPEIAAKLMQPFFTTKEVGKGTGLGLSISRGILEGHGGRLFLNPTLKQTQFVIELPVLQGKTLSTPNQSQLVA